MHVVLHYRDRGYATEGHADENEVSISTGKDGEHVVVSVRFFRKGAGGELAPSALVHGCGLNLGVDEARKLASAILWQLESGNPEPLTYRQRSKP